MKPLVSVITPSYNQAKYLDATLRSVFKQDYPALEYIVVDGASTDGSQKIIEAYDDQLAWWISEPDQGQADAINKGFQKANGEIIAWLNSDDLYLPGTISEAVEIFEKNPDAGMVYGDAVSADGNGKLLNELRFDHRTVADFLKFKMICQPAVFMKKEILDQVGYLNISYQFFLDHELWIRIAREANLVHCPRIWAVSRYHQEAKNFRLASQSGQEVTRILDWAETQPDLSEIISTYANEIWAGANQITARYLLDSGNSAEAFRFYFKAVRIYPPSLRAYWHRFLFSALSMVGLGFLGEIFYRIKNKQPLVLKKDQRLENWPGIGSNF